MSFKVQEYWFNSTELRFYDIFYSQPLNFREQKHKESFQIKSDYLLRAVSRSLFIFRFSCPFLLHNVCWIEDRDIKSYNESFVEATKKIKIQKKGRKLCKEKSFLGLFMLRLRKKWDFDAETNDSKTYLSHKLNRNTTRIINIQWIAVPK